MDGAYDMSVEDDAVRKAGAQVLLANENEWYKATYYDPMSSSYFDYPGQFEYGADRGGPRSDGEYGELQ